MAKGILRDLRYLLIKYKPRVMAYSSGLAWSSVGGRISVQKWMIPSVASKNGLWVNFNPYKLLLSSLKMDFYSQLGPLGQKYWGLLVWDFLQAGWDALTVPQPAVMGCRYCRSTNSVKALKKYCPGKLLTCGYFQTWIGKQPWRQGVVNRGRRIQHWHKARSGNWRCCLCSLFH